ncbi:electron transport complex subunit RsxC [Flocculibacter collagenilyticus]|uniref:electron transport complex subunit RsxC n=1 Tax=Flocculibacter collagenilyticus TaxID=2744479 RepID=UPI0018F6A0AA|nr:electron transport complex subunit RsxC [Flocculibacter collagenilyticus]
METLHEKILRGQLWQSPGGVHPPTNKHTTNTQPVATLPLAEKIIIPVKQHIGHFGEVLVKQGDHVLKGQPLSKPKSGLSLPVHASTSGTVVDIKPMPSAHPSAIPELSIIIEPDGDDRWTELHPILDYTLVDKTELIAKIQQSGISGLGGAGFPSYIKAQTALSRPIEYLIINGVECEPYITADDRLMQDYATHIRAGIDILVHLLQPQNVIVGIEDDKPLAIEAMKAACKSDESILIRAIPTKYPSGGEKQLIQILTGKQVPTGGIPADIGMVMQNVGTVHAIANAVQRGEPLISRIVTVAGDTIEKAQNYWVPLGTPISHVLKECHFTPEVNQRVIMGGPMMGFTLPHLNIPVVKITNCILAPSEAELPNAGKEMECIRCSACADVCPASLLPQQLQWYAKNNEHEKSKEYNLFDCIECGACAYVCPSEIPLVEYYRVEKATIKQLDEEQRQAEQAKKRFEQRNQRLEREKQERAEKHRLAAEKRRQAMEGNNEKDKVADALARIKAKKAGATQGVNENNTAEQNATDNTERSPKDAVAAAIARAKAKKANANANANVEHQKKPTDNANSDNEKDKAAGSDANITNTQDNPKKAAIAAAVARAKAKKEAQNKSLNETNSQPELKHQVTSSAESKASELPQENESSASKSNKQEAIAAAIARAKAKRDEKLAELQRSEHSTSTTATKQSSATSSTEPKVTEEKSSISSNDAESPEQQKKAKIAAAIARAKAKREQQENTKK